jgi:hypothetical protein
MINKEFLISAFGTFIEIQVDFKNMYLKLQHYASFSKKKESEKESLKKAPKRHD